MPEKTNRPWSKSCCKPESIEAREARIFGGEEGEKEDTDLRGPMLDVVLGLFNGLDYDDGA
jgi:hypothetical protein